METKRLTRLSLLLAASIVLSIVESFIPPIGIPGAKLGLANAVTIILLYHYSDKDAFLVLILRILLVGLLRGSIFQYPFWLSLSGGMVAFTFMYTFKKLKIFSQVSVSVMGSLGHSIGQIVMAIFLLETRELVFYFPLLFIIAVPTGIFIGFLSTRYDTIMTHYYDQ